VREEGGGREGGREAGREGGRERQCAGVWVREVGQRNAGANGKFSRRAAPGEAIAREREKERERDRQREREREATGRHLGGLVTHRVA
jgi:hypothetical protein